MPNPKITSAEKLRQLLRTKNVRHAGAILRGGASAPPERVGIALTLTDGSNLRVTDKTFASVIGPIVETANEHSIRDEAPIFIHGPRGCGKTHHAKWIAETFGRTIDDVVDEWSPGDPINGGDVYLCIEPPRQEDHPRTIIVAFDRLALPRQPAPLLDDVPAQPDVHDFAYFIYGREGSDVHDHGCMFARIFGLPERNVIDDWQPGQPWKQNIVYTTTASPLTLPRGAAAKRIDFSQVSIPGIVDVTDPLPRHHHFTCGTAHVRAQATLQLLRPMLGMGTEVGHETIESLSYLVETAGLAYAAKIVGIGTLDEDVPF